MRISVSSNGIIELRHPARGERYLREAGFDSVALSLQAMIDPEDPVTAHTSVPVIVVKAPSALKTLKGNPYAKPEDVMRAAEASKNMGAKFFLTDTTEDDLIRALTDTFAGSDIKVLITNSCRYFGGRYMRGRFSEIHDVLEVMEKYDRDRLGFCFDTGEANLCGQDSSELLHGLREVMDAVTVSENDGVHPYRHIPFSLDHTQDWRAFFRGMRQIGFDGELIFDAATSMWTTPVPLRGDKVREIYRMAEYFRWQIEMDKVVAKYPKRVLFGAGNMCRAYLRDYREQYPPLFTVDNDSKVWGSNFEGVEVRSPEALKDLEADTAIFICITYYREIHDQLREMGITNPIEYFNDEYPNTIYEGKRLHREWIG